MAGPLVGIESDDLREFRAHLRSLGDEWPKELRGLHRGLADDLAGKAQAEAQALGGVHAKAAGTIRGKGSQTSARVGPVGGQGIGNVAFWGAERHTGWYADPRYADSPPQHPEWVGSSWDVGGPGGPYAINSTIRREADRIVDRYGDVIDTLARKAGFT